MDTICYQELSQTEEFIKWPLSTWKALASADLVLDIAIRSLSQHAVNELRLVFIVIHSDRNVIDKKFSESCESASLPYVSSYGETKPKALRKKFDAFFFFGKHPKGIRWYANKVAQCTYT